MNVIDDEGRLFGFVNVIDALVVPVLLAVLLAGAAFVFGGGDAETATQYATIELGNQPEHVATLVSAGDTSTFQATGDNLTVTDVYVTSTGDGGFFVTVRAELNGRLVENERLDQRVFEFGGSLLRTGGELTIETPDYSVTGVVRDVSRNDSEIALETTDAVVQLRNVDPDIADALSVGMTERVDGRTVARVTNVSVEPSDVVVQSDAGDLFLREHPRNRDIRLELELLTRQTPTGLWFHGQRLRVNTPVNLDLDRITVSGRVIGIG